jgi:hypothetical protein
MKIFYSDLFRAAPYRLMLALHKDENKKLKIKIAPTYILYQLSSFPFIKNIFR